MSKLTPTRFDFSKARLDEIDSLCWTVLKEGVEDKSSPFRFPILASATSQGVDARVLVLRRVDEHNRMLDFHTDKRSAKVQQLENNPNVVWVFYDPTRKLQLRVATTARVFVDGAALDASWSVLSEHSKRAYAQHLVPGTPVDEIRNGAPCSHVEDPETGKTNFSVVECKVRQIEWLALSRSGHQCALMRQTADGWSSTWIMP